MSLAILAILLWKPAYYLTKYAMYKEPEDLSQLKNWGLSLWDLVKPTNLKV